jgi:hypothetical protein
MVALLRTAARPVTRVARRALSTGDTAELALLEQLLKQAKDRNAAIAAAEAAANASAGPRFQIQARPNTQPATTLFRLPQPTGRALAASRRRTADLQRHLADRPQEVPR